MNFQVSWANDQADEMKVKMKVEKIEKTKDLCMNFQCKFLASWANDQADEIKIEKKSDLSVESLQILSRWWVKKWAYKWWSQEFKQESR